MIPALYESSEELFRSFAENREAAVARAAEYFSVQPATVLETIQHLEATCRDHPCAHAYFNASVGAFRRADLVFEDLQRLCGIRLQGARVLDLGCGGGDAMRAAWSRGAADVRGLEYVAPRASGGNDMLARYGLPRTIHAGSILDRDAVAQLGTGFDVVLLFDVTEHVPSVAELVAVVRPLVKPGGVVVIRAGNPFNPGLLLSEPHYGLPGMTVLSRASALRYFCARMSGDYEVFEWLQRAELEATLRRAGFTIEAAADERTHPASEFDRVAKVLTEETTYPDAGIEAEVKQAIRYLRLLRVHAPDPEAFFGVQIFTIVARLPGVAEVPEVTGVAATPPARPWWKRALAALHARLRRAGAAGAA